jgi:hypothetical protein
MLRASDLDLFCRALGCSAPRRCELHRRIHERITRTQNFSLWLLLMHVCLRDVTPVITSSLHSTAGFAAMRPCIASFPNDNYSSVLALHTPRQKPAFLFVLSPPALLERGPNAIETPCLLQLLPGASHSQCNCTAANLQSSSY